LTIALFPGQGVQAPGMDGGLADLSADVFATASKVFDIDIAELCRQGSSGDATLTSTLWAQPAVLTCGVAAFRALSERGETFTAVAGHSVGEYAALVTGGALDLADALRLIALRAKATEDAARLNPGGMLAVMRIERDEVEAICERTGAALAADNSSGQLVISGSHDALQKAHAAAEEAGAKCRTLEVAGAFHSPAMRPAAAPLSAALSDVEFNAPEIEMWSATTAAPLSDPVQIKQVLIDQLESPVRFRETLEGAKSKHGSSFTDLGPGRVVGALAKRVVKDADIKFIAELLPAGASS
jgi:[acyl-carrier-protein] S-malonyltransferase